MTVGYLLQRDSGAHAARNLDFCRLGLIFFNLERSRLILGLRVCKGGKGPSAGIVLRLIQIQLHDVRKEPSGAMGLCRTSRGDGKRYLADEKLTAILQSFPANFPLWRQK
jgi:hypothetical protein